MRPDSITLAIFEKYKPEELAATAQQMAQAQADRETAETEKKMSDAVFAERIKGHAAKVSELAGKYNKGGEAAQIGCTIRYDIPTVGKKSYIRMDTEETVEVHDMSLDEKQETIQFPLSAQMADAENEKKDETQPAPEISEEPATGLTRDEPRPPTEITFKDIQAIAAHIVACPDKTLRDAGVADMTATIAPKLLAQQKAIGPDGQVVTIETKEAAIKLASEWLKLGMEVASKPEEVTRLCPYPGCIDFADHDGDHTFPKAAAPEEPRTNEAPQPQTEKQKKPRSRRRSPAEPPQAGAPA